MIKPQSMLRVKIGCSAIWCSGAEVDSKEISISSANIFALTFNWFKSAWIVETLDSGFPVRSLRRVKNYHAGFPFSKWCL